jgi:hypothetical protein
MSAVSCRTEGNAEHQPNGNPNPDTQGKVIERYAKRRADANAKCETDANVSRGVRCVIVHTVYAFIGYEPDDC